MKGGLQAAMKLLLHACCGPCSLEPVRLLLEEGHDITICFANSNIHPRAEYDHRLEVLRTWAAEEGLPVVDLPYNDAAWHAQVGVLEEKGSPREDRCRACYHMRLEEAACYASKHGFEALSTTLAVSPYQFSEACHEELQAACERHGLICIWQDFRPYYADATKRSRELGMYRQNYCGCTYSKAEAQAEREQRAAEKAAAAKAREAEQAQLKAERRERQAEYDRKQALKRAAREAYRASVRAEDEWQG